MVEFEHASFSYGAAPVLDDITFSVDSGAFCVIYGRPGTGKTTLLRLCRGEIAASAGEVRVLGWPVQLRDRKAVAGLRRRVGFIGRHNRFLEHLTVAENIAVPLIAGGRRPEGRADDLTALLTWVGLDDHAASYPGRLSPAEARRAALARAVISSPELIIADEPVGGLSREAALDITSLILDLHAMGTTVVLASNDGDLVEHLIASRPMQVAHLEAGNLEMVT